VQGKRARIVVAHILEHGFITTEQLEQIYGYKHPPRAVKDVRDQGIPIETFSVKSSGGRTIAAYRFGNRSDVIEGRIGGRAVFSRQFKAALYEQSGGKCAICNGSFESRELQIDHKIPYEVAGDTAYSEENTEAYMLLCGSCNRTKSWSCENCPNWETKSTQVCTTCYWAEPTNYEHIALKEVRRTDILWEGTGDIELYDKLHKSATQLRLSLAEYIKKLLRNLLLMLLRVFSWLFFIHKP
jgi:hypothetical protein